MVNRTIISVVTVTLLLGAAPVSVAQGIPDWENSWAEMPGGSEVWRVLFNVPDGTGSSFTQARNLDGPLDATITLFLRDGNNNPVVDYPSEDIWVTSSLDP